MSGFVALYEAHQAAFVIALLGLLTLATRAGGYLVLARFKRIPARLEAALEAVPVAVISTLVVPPAFSGGLAEFATVAFAVIACLRLPSMVVIVAGLGLIVGLRMVGL
jgi:uncharacterized membrane protein